MLQIIKQLTASSPERCTIESGPYSFHYLIAGAVDAQKVIFLVFTEKSYPKRYGRRCICKTGRWWLGLLLQAGI
jgi:hypothetical protein